MKKNLLYSVIAIALLCIPNTSWGQVLNLGTLTNFAAYSGTGAVSNAGTSTLVGDVGSNVGAVTGFGLPTTAGTIHHADAITTQAKIDLLRVYIHLSDLAVTNTTHAPAFGGGETITAGVYSIAGAGSLTGTVTLNGQGNANAAFVIKFEGAFTAAASSNVVLSNGTRACNVFWISEGAISIGASSTARGTLIAHPGAVTVAAGSTLEGRMFSTEGAITFGPGVASLPAGPITIPIKCNNTCNNNILGTAANFALFTSAGAVANAATSGIIGDIGSNAGAVSGFASSTVAGSFHNVDAVTAQAKIDLQAAYTQLIAIPNTNTTHTPAFGSGETLTAGVYSIAAAGSLAGTITLDAQGNPDALFIFKFGGAFTTAAQSKVIFINGVRRCNVFWIAEGAVSMGTFTFMKGTLIAHNGANTMGANGNLEGRMLSTTGAIGFSTGVIYTNTMCFEAPIPTIIAIDDTDTPSINGYTGGTIYNILSNDRLNGYGVAPSQVNTTFVSSTNPGITLSGINVIVAAGTPEGEYNLTYSICEIANPTNCSQAVVYIRVSAPDITAVNDAITINGLTGGTFTNVLANDTLNEVAVIPSQVTVSFVSSTNAGITLSGTNVIVAAGTPVGTYSLVYRTCQILNPTNCTQATVTVVITAPIPPAIVCGNNVTMPACSTQAQVNAAWTLFLASTTASGGNNGVLTNNGTTAPTACGGYKDVVWTYTVINPTTVIKCTKRFTVVSTPAVVLNCGVNVTMAACSTQAQVNAGWTSFKASTTASGGCNGVLTNNAPSSAPLYNQSGYVDVTWTYTVTNTCGVLPAGCNSNGQVSCTKRFTVSLTGCKINKDAISVNTTGLTTKSLDVNVYPNPYTESFNLNLKTSSIEKIGLSVYDMTGKLIEQREVNAAEVAEMQVGNQYSSGIYNIIITQGNEVKRFQVIKR